MLASPPTRGSGLQAGVLHQPPQALGGRSKTSWGLRTSPCVPAARDVVAVTPHATCVYGCTEWFERDDLDGFGVVCFCCHVSPF